MAMRQHVSIHPVSCAAVDDRDTARRHWWHGGERRRARRYRRRRRPRATPPRQARSRSALTPRASHCCKAGGGGSSCTRYSCCGVATKVLLPAAASPPSGTRTSYASMRCAVARAASASSRRKSVSHATIDCGGRRRVWIHMRRGALYKNGAAHVVVHARPVSRWRGLAQPRTCPVAVWRPPGRSRTIFGALSSSAARAASGGANDVCRRM